MRNALVTHVAVAAAAAVGVAVAVAGCPDCGPPVQPPPGSPFGSQPIRRLTQEQLNHSLRDLFVGVAVPFVALNDGDVGSRGGFEGDVTRQTPSDLAVEQLRAGSLAVAQTVVANKDAFLAQNGAGGDAHAAIAALLPRAFRRPAEQREIDAYTKLYDDTVASDNDNVALALVVQAVIQSPSFVYRVEDAAAAPYAVASRLSYLLWSTMPDDALFDAAANDALSDPDALEAQARRMLDDPKAREGVLSFHRQWLDLDKVLSTNKDAATFPEWNDDLRRSMRTEADKMIEEAVFATGDAKLRTLLTTTKTRIDFRLAPIYGVPAPAQPWDLVELPADERAGLLTNAAFLSSRGHQAFGSPVLRGVYVLDRFLCEAPPPPPPDVSTNPPDPSGDDAPRTNRERFAQHSFDDVCKGCHTTIDGIGFGLEGYDSIGRFRTQDNGFDVDDTGSVDGTEFHGARELAAFLSEAPGVQRCVTTHWLDFTRGRAFEPADTPTNDDVVDAFAAADGDIKELIVSIVRTPELRALPPGAGAGGAR